MHICNNKKCVNPDHLELGTHQENISYMVACGRQSRGSKHYDARLTEKDVIKLRQLHSQGISANQLGKQFDISKTSVLRIIHRKNWKHI